MNAGLDDTHSSIQYYDGDYPSPITSLYPENFDDTTEYQGLAHDIARYRELAAVEGGRILDLCCGTGRVTIPLARDGYSITGVDISEGMLARFRMNLHREAELVQKRIEIVQQDISQLDLAFKDYDFALIAFNSLLCITTFKRQQQALEAVARHLRTGALLAIDIVNPLSLKIEGDSVPKPFFTRRNPETGNTYTRFAMSDPFDADHQQRLHGWYDELEPDGHIKRTFYSLHWRPVFRFEIELMLERVGFGLEEIQGGHLHEPYTAKSPRMFVISRRYKNSSEGEVSSA
jgi:SAM-dependent methyltransferase